VHSGVNGAKAASPNSKIVIHIDNGWDKTMVQNWYKGMIIQGAFTAADVDIMGFSFYPFYGTDSILTPHFLYSCFLRTSSFFLSIGTSATVANLKSSLSNIISLYGKDVIVAETDFPYACSGVTLSESISPGTSGQTSWVAKIRDTLSSLSGGHGVGIIYWEPGEHSFFYLSAFLIGRLRSRDVKTPFVPNTFPAFK
jgi:arabinogalactan endo-1,4-beta-galactosidase